MVIAGKQYTNIRIKPRFILPLPGFGNRTCQAAFGKIWVPPWIYADLCSNKPRPKLVATILHEQEHLNRQKITGSMRWLLKYVFSSNFRLNEELAAVKPQLRYLKSKGEIYDCEYTARHYSGPLYLWCASYEDALAKLRNEWIRA